jgi:hypothetical protein
VKRPKKKTVRKLPLKPKGKPARKKKTVDITLRRATQAAARRERTRQGQDIGKLPKCKNPARRAECMASFEKFCKTYSPEIFYLPWSKDLRKVIAKIERVVIDHDKVAVAMPRGSGKSALCRSAILWAVLSGRHSFVVLIGATAPQGSAAVEWFKKALSENRLLLEDFPEVCFPLKLLENEPRRCLGQRYKGAKTNIRWGKDQIVLPTIPGSVASGFVIAATSLEGQIRGMWHTLPDGRVVRPTLALADDPQTAESARSQGPNGQTTYRLQTINQDVQGLAGPDQQTAILVPCTVICPGDLADQILNRKQYPDFRGERTKRLYSWPTNKAMWEQYRQLREQAMQGDQPLTDATDFYRARMCKVGRKLDTQGDCGNCPHKAECMDCGAVVDWAERLDDPRNLSAVQAAMHAFYKYGASGFAAEFQNEPLANSGSDAILTADLCQMRYNGRRQYEVPLECTELVMGVDMQQSSLWYVVAAFKLDFTGFVIDYGVWPRQIRRNFTLKDVVDGNANFQTMFPGRGVEGTIQAGLEEFIGRSLATDYAKAGGGLMRLSRVLVDSGKWPGTIAAVKHKIGGAVMMLSKGVGIRAGNKPMSSYKRKKGERHDPYGHWYMPSVDGTREFPHVGVDTNYWKSFLHSSLLTAPGDPGALTLFGDDPELHGLFAAHITAETFVETEGHGRKVQEWTIKPQRPDNHWLDAGVLAAVAASIQGVTIPNRKEPPRTGIVRRKRVSIDELLARRQVQEAAS